jgi:multisubunit Na+/H+ antiporter MnhE subunit
MLFARRGLTWLAWWAVLMGLWLLLVNNVKLAELCAGAAAAAIAATVALVLSEQRLVALQPRLSWFPRLPLALAQLPLDSARLTVALVRALVKRSPPRGSFRAVRWRTLGDDPESEQRRAVAEALDSVGPNSYVIGIDRERGALLVHQLLRQEDPESADPMRLR